jgi:broad specificity phosphatase PhoE
VSNIYLVRHGQAGTRDAYDQLSDLGRKQARFLGEYFAAQRIKFSLAYSGSMNRQRETAAGVQAAYKESGSEFPQIVPRPEWDEFNLDQIYQELAPRMCDDDPEFRAQYEAMRQQVRSSGGAHTAEVHRRWLPCDSQIVKAWIAGKYSYQGESWQAFLSRVAGSRAGMRNGAHATNIIVFTSAMPVAIWTGMALDIADERILRLAGVLHNASYSVVRLRTNDLRLFTFNAVPHLLEDHLRTHR